MSKKIQEQEKKNKYRKVTFTLGQTQEDILDDIRSRIIKGGGARLGRTEIVRSLLDSLKSLILDLDNVQGEPDLLDRIRKAKRT